MNKNEVEAKVKELMAAPQCCAELKAACEKYLSTVNGDQHTQAVKNLVAELEADVQTIDAVLALFSSEMGAKIFGADTAKMLTEKAQKVKAEGGKYCFCSACTIGRELLEHKEQL